MFALISYGGTTPGHRPATRLAYIEGESIQTWNARAQAWIRCTKKRDEVTVYRTWERHPADTQVRRAKLTLKPEE